MPNNDAPRKNDAGKAPLGLIPESALTEVAFVLQHGNGKYGTGNWRKGTGLEWMRLANASLRHIVRWISGETIDPSSGYHHLAHAIASLVMLLEYYHTKNGIDDRW